MLFDLRGRGRRRTVQTIYLGLAVLMGVGLVGFGIGGGFGGGGLLNAASENEGASKASFSGQVKKYEKLTRTQPTNVGAWEQLTRAQLHEAGGEAYVNNRQLTSKGRELYSQVADSWEHYLALNPPNPSLPLAKNMLLIYSEEGLNRPPAAVQALQIVVAAEPTNAAYYSQLALYAYKAHNTRVGDLASARALRLLPASQRTRVKSELEAAKKNPGGGETLTGTTNGKAFTVKPNGKGGYTGRDPDAHLEHAGEHGARPEIAGNGLVGGHEHSRERTQAGGAATERQAPYAGRLLVSCPDRPGIVAAVSGFLFERGANIVSSHQFSSDPTGGRFFLRVEFFLEAAADGAEGPERARGRELLQAAFGEEVGARFQMTWRIRWWGQRQRVAIMVSRHDHCLLDLLWRWRRGELDGDIVTVISNHAELERETEAAGVPYHHVPVHAGAKEGAERVMLELLEGQADLLVLARYMQVLSGEFLERVGMPAINIHHSFLPAFAGANPYRQAHERGVKLIGATAHYVTEQLDDGPIIDQDVVRVDHRQGAQELERVGRDVERLVLARAVALHLDERVLVDGRRTVVF